MGSGLLETAIGLVLVYLTLSFLCMGINEWIARATKMRATFLEDGIKRLVGSDISETVYKHPLVRALSEERDRRPSYIPGKTFSRVLLAVIPTLGQTTTTGKPPAVSRAMLERIDNEHVKKTMLLLWDEAGGKIDDVKRSVEGWFDDTMDRVSGWYKRRAQTITLIVALGVAVTLNADTIRIATTLWTNPTLRSALVAQAEQTVQQPDAKETPSPPTVAESLQIVQALPLPLGWQPADAKIPKREAPSGKTPADTTMTQVEDPRALPGNFWEVLIKLLGLVITAGALTMGAPFWFDLLQRFVGIRAAGKPPAKDAKPSAAGEAGAET